MTMANSTVASPLRSSASLRKTNKPLMEKRRRARINDSLSQLKSLVISGTKKESSQFNKLEKADILELTVKHLRNLQNHQQQLQQQQINNESSATVGPKYQDGFIECANEVIRYLGQAQGFSDDTKCRVINHLASCIQLANTKASFAKAMHAQPAPQGAPAPTQAAVANGVLPSASSSAAHQALQLGPAPVSTQGQIIQIVTAAPQVSQLAAKPQSSNAVRILASNPSSTAVNISPASIPSSSPAMQQIPVPNYAQPLHIQIPPAFSPVLVANNNPRATSTSKSMPQKQQLQQAAFQHHRLQQQQHHHLQQHYPQAMDITNNQSDIPTPSPPQTSATMDSVAYMVGKPQELQVTANRPILPATPESMPSPQQATISPQPQQTAEKDQDQPITHVHKIHGFYSSAGDFGPTRPRTFSTTSTSSTSSSSSSSACSPSENTDLSIPLNLTQTPCGSLDFELRQGRRAEGAIKPRHFMDKNNKRRMASQYNTANNNISASTTTDQENILSNISTNIFRTAAPPSANSCSPPVLAMQERRLSPDNPALNKYVALMMEEDRQCGRSQGLRSRSTSPASSVGEDRLWRPW